MKTGYLTRITLIFLLLTTPCFTTILSAEEPPTITIEDDNLNKDNADTEKKPGKKWTVLVYIQAANNLNSFALKNLREMAYIGSTDEMTILVELHRGGNKSWRYIVKQNHCVVDEVLPRPPEKKASSELVSAVKWAVKKAPADHYALILWNHGSGIIDPIWGGGQPYYNIKSRDNSRGHNNNSDIASSGEKEFTPSRASRNKIARKRGILFDDERQHYMTNTELRTTMKTISRDILGGKKLDLLGMDACFMGMIEISYQCKEFCKYFVASQDFEYARGWSYGALFQKLHQKEVSGELFSKAIVSTFNDYYKTKTDFFTQSALDMSHIPDIKNGIDLVAEQLLACKEEDPHRMKKIISRARSQCLQFYTPDYIDLSSFLKELQKLVKRETESEQKNISSESSNRRSRNKRKRLRRSESTRSRRNHHRLRVSSETLENLLTAINTCNTIINKAVIANSTGKHLSRAQGISICFPQTHIDKSYIKTEFAKDSLWTDFIYDHLTT